MKRILMGSVSAWVILGKWHHVAGLHFPNLKDRVELYQHNILWN